MHATGPTYLPIGLRVDHAPALVVGSGLNAINKARLLVPRSSDIRIFATNPVGELQALIAAKVLRLVGAEEDLSAIKEALKGACVIFIATEDAERNREIAKLANASGVLCCVVDDIPPSRFITPAIIDRSPVQVAILTGGAAPVLARRLRTRIETLLPTNLGALARFMQARRGIMKSTFPDMTQRRHTWERFLDALGLNTLAHGELSHANDALNASIAQEHTNTGKLGEVLLVGAGPGDPELLTLAALHAMQNADCVLYDQLIPEVLLDRLRRDAERIFVGKRKSHHTLPQSEITAILIEKARQGLRVVRLKGGDPFIFGRGGEEMDALTREGISVRVIPGITAASGCGAAAGIPLTHRDYAQSCIFVTGHAKAGEELSLNWDNLAKEGQTLAIYMGLTALATLSRKLIAHGLPPEWPVAIIERGTWENQTVTVSTLAGVPDAITAGKMASPAMTIIGEVVNLRK